MALTNTGAYVPSSVSGTYYADSVADYNFFASGASADAYPASAPDQNFLQFGFRANVIIITNESANDLVVQWPKNYGSAADGLVVKANSTLTILHAYKSGMKIRSRNAGQSANWIVTAL